MLKLAGLDLSADRSGKTSDTATPVISKKGKADLRYALYQAAFIASTRYRPWIEKYTDQLQGRAKEPGIKTKRWVKLSAKFLIIAWTIMKKKGALQPALYKSGVTKKLIIPVSEPGQQRRGLLWTSGGTIMGRSLNFKTWIRDDGCPPRAGCRILITLRFKVRDW